MPTPPPTTPPPPAPDQPASGRSSPGPPSPGPPSPGPPSPGPRSPGPRSPGQGLRPAPPCWDDRELPHPRLLTASAGITAVQFVVTAAGVVSDADAVRNVVALVSVALFVLGSVAFMVAFVIAAGRSRTEDLWFGGAFFLTGRVAAPRMRTMLLLCLAAQVVIGLVGASLAPFTALAFGVLVPMSGLGLLALYGARWGEFSPKTDRE